MHYVLVINPGSTSTKIALYHGLKVIFHKTLNHDPQELAGYDRVSQQYQMRKELILDCLKENKINLSSLSAVAARGGLLPPVKSGAYLVNRAMLDHLEFKPILEHASNLGALIAHSIALPLKINAYIYDPVTVDEMEPINCLTGLPEVKRRSIGHFLNMRSCALKYASENLLDYKKINLIVAHLGGGSTLSLHQNGRMVDMISDDEGPFSAERAGGLPSYALIDLCKTYSDQKEIIKKLRQKGGLLAHCGTTNAIEIERRIQNGDLKTKMVYEAMALNIAKNIAKLSVVTCGCIDAIILTGGLSQSQLLTAWVKDRVSFIAKIVLMPGENEMEALAHGVLRVLKGEEKAMLFEENIC